jgi:ketosteroid isomerase-like protein
MSEVVRIPISPDARLPARRTLDERFYLRWPNLYEGLSRAVLSLPPRSRVRRALMRRTTLSGWGAWARGDLELTLLRFAPGYELKPAREFLAVGIRSSYEGHAGVREWAADMRDAWEQMEMRPLEIVDAGNPIVSLGQAHFRARGSGIEFDYRFGAVFWTERGLIVRELHFADWDEALRAADITTAAVGSGPPRVMSAP